MGFATLRTARTVAGNLIVIGVAFAFAAHDVHFSKAALTFKQALAGKRELDPGGEDRVKVLTGSTTQDVKSGRGSALRDVLGHLFDGPLAVLAALDIFDVDEGGARSLGRVEHPQQIDIGTPAVEEGMTMDGAARRDFGLPEQSRCRSLRAEGPEIPAPAILDGSEQALTPQSYSVDSQVDLARGIVHERESEEVERETVGQ